jgi:hypothetical protein
MSLLVQSYLLAVYSSSEEESEVPQLKKPCDNSKPELSNNIMQLLAAAGRITKGGKETSLGWNTTLITRVHSAYFVWKVTIANRWSVDNQTIHKLEISCGKNESSCTK